MIKNTDAKTTTGKIVALIIFVFFVISIFYEMFKLNLPIIDPIVAFINDTHRFMTLLCFIYGVYAFVIYPKSYSLGIFCFVDIIIINRLYSDKKWSAIIEWLQKSNMQLIFFCSVVVVISIYVFYKVGKIIRNKSKHKDEEYKEHDSNNNTKYISSRDEKENRNEETMEEINNEETIEEMNNEETMEEMNNEETIVEINKERIIEPNEITNNERYLPKTEGTDGQGRVLKCVNPYVVVICVAIIGLGIVDYVCYQVLPFDIDRPECVEKYKNYLYFGAVIALAALVALLILNLFILWRKAIAEQVRQIVDKRSSFGISGILALIIEVVGIFHLINSSNAENITNSFLNALANNWFAFIFALVIIFLILQIGWTIILHVIGGKKQDESDDETFVPVLKNGISKIEMKMVKLACDVVKGCVDLFDFIPDFFATIGVLLFDKDGKDE